MLAPVLIVHLLSLSLWKDLELRPHLMLACCICMNSNRNVVGNFRMHAVYCPHEHKVSIFRSTFLHEICRYIVICQKSLQFCKGEWVQCGLSITQLLGHDRLHTPLKLHTHTHTQSDAWA